MTVHCLLHRAAGRQGSDAARWLESRPSAALVVEVSGPAELVGKAAAGLPEGPARAEAIAVRLRRRGVSLEWGQPRVAFENLDDALAFCRRRGSSSVEIMRADPSLVTELQIGSWFQASWRERAARWLALWTHRFPRPSRSFRVAADAAFWAGVREAATAREWERLTRSSYVALVYHRLAGEKKPGQERVDLSPGRFEEQLEFLRRLGFVPLSADEILAFHGDTARTLPRRSLAVTVDDGFLDCVEPLARHTWSRPQLFVPTAELGGKANWLGGEPVMNWEDVGRLAAAGVSVGSHGRSHRHLTALDDQELAKELEGSLADLDGHLDRPLALLAYPNGKFDERVRKAAAAAGFEAAYSTEKGRNGAGTDPYCLRRVSVHAWDGRLAVLWKVTTGEAVPAFFWTWRRLAARMRRARPSGA